MRPDRILDIVIPVYNDAPYLAESLTSIFKQQLPNHWSYHVYVVDDGSDIAIRIDFPTDYSSNITILRLEQNSGASIARNEGAKAGDGEALLFLDADCSFSNSEALSSLIERYNQDFDVCFGQIHAPQGDFWARYQNNVAEERVVRFRAGERSCMTTAIFLVKRENFKSIGGFDEAYHFGFEDRDLFIALIKSGAKLALLEDALVNHNDQLSLISVTKKLYGSGATSSARFREKYPEEYMNMSYAKADVRSLKGSLSFLAFTTKNITWPLIRAADWAIRKNLLPDFISTKLVKYLSGLAYLHGTKASSESRQ